MSFGETLQKLRKQRGWSQEELAEKLELTRQTISKWELEQSNPDLEYIIALSDLFQVSTDYLIRGEEHIAEKQETAPVNNANTSNGISDTRSVIIWVIIGSVLLFTGLSGVIVFMALAAVNPASALVNGYFYEGLLGFLIHFRAVPYFIICVLLLLSGAALYVLALLKYHRQKKNASAE